jgi:putative ABC transport system permease protein
LATIRSGLLGEIVTMSVDTLRTSKMRSALTVLGVVIGITSIVGMTSLIRGFDNSLRDSIGQLGPNTNIVQKWGALSIVGYGKS